MRIAVVGANGFVGRHLTRFLLDQGINTTTIGRRDLTPEALDRALAGCDALVNCAGDKRGVGADAHEANVVLPRRLLEAAIVGGGPAMLQVSSVAALTSETAPRRAVSDAADLQPSGAYGRSKREGDDAILQAAEAMGYAGLAVLRPPILIGADAGGVFALLRSMARAGVPLPLGGIDNRRSIMHVDNFAAAILAAIRARCSGAFVVTDSPPLSSAELYARMLATAGRGNRLFTVGAAGRALLRKAMGSRGESLFGDAAFDGRRFAAITHPDWPVPPSQIVESAMVSVASS
jgi:nucleoside-diphosphate-sugar epimerase